MDSNITTNEEEKNNNPETDDKINNSTNNGENKLLDDNKVNVDILPKVGGNSIIINICSCFNWSYSDSDKKDSLVKQK